MSSRSADGPKVTLGHLALHYPNNADGPVAAHLLELLGFQKAQEFPLPNGSTFYQYYVDPNGQNNGDGIVYLSVAPEPVATIMSAIRDTLKIGAPEQHPAVAAFRKGQQQDPEMCQHLGLLFSSLDRIENIVVKLRTLAESEAAFKSRIKIAVNAARPGDAEIDARMEASPVFKGVTRYPYGRNAIQVFIETNLLMSGPLGESMVIELDYVFPDRARHLFNSTEA